MRLGLSLPAVALQNQQLLRAAKPNPTPSNAMTLAGDPLTFGGLILTFGN